MNALRRLNEGLPALVGSILIYGLLLICIGVWLVDDRLHYVSGSVIGIALAVYMAISIASVIRDAVDTEAASLTRLKIKSVLRYIVVAVILFLMMYFRLGSLIPAFLGILGLKICAYAQPFIHRHVLHDWEEEDSDELGLTTKEEDQ